MPGGAPKADFTENSEIFSKFYSYPIVPALSYPEEIMEADRNGTTVIDPRKELLVFPQLCVPGAPGQPVFGLGA